MSYIVTTYISVFNDLFTYRPRIKVAELVCQWYIYHNDLYTYNYSRI